MNGILSVSSFCEVCSAVSRSISWARCLLLEQKLIFQLGTLSPHGINERFSFH